MKKKNIEILFEAFQVMVRRMKTSLDNGKVGKYVSDLFKKFPQIKRTKPLERQLQEMIKEYILLQEIDEIENMPKKNIEKKKLPFGVSGENISSPQKFSQEHVHFLKHPIQRCIAAIGVLGLGLLLAIPLMKNQVETPQASFREAFDQMKSTFKWEGPKMPSLDEVLEAKHYSFVLEGEIPEIPQLPAVSFTALLTKFPSDAQRLPFPLATDSIDKVYSKSLILSQEKALEKAISFLNTKLVPLEKYSAPFIEAKKGAMCFDEACDSLKLLGGEKPEGTEISSYVISYSTFLGKVPLFAAYSPDGAFRPLEVEVSALTGTILSALFSSPEVKESLPVVLKTASEIKDWLKSEDSLITSKRDDSVWKSDHISKNIPIILKNPTFGYLVFGSAYETEESNPYLFFDAVGRNEEGEDVFFKQRVPLVGGE